MNQHQYPGRLRRQDATLGFPFARTNELKTHGGLPTYVADSSREKRKPMPLSSSVPSTHIPQASVNNQVDWDECLTVREKLTAALAAAKE